jgi:hypothetical protein
MCTDKKEKHRIKDLPVGISSVRGTIYAQLTPKKTDRQIHGKGLQMVAFWFREGKC